MFCSGWTYTLQATISPAPTMLSKAARASASKKLTKRGARFPVLVHVHRLVDVGLVANQDAYPSSDWLCMKPAKLHYIITSVGFTHLQPENGEARTSPKVGWRFLLYY